MKPDTAIKPVRASGTALWSLVWSLLLFFGLLILLAGSGLSVSGAFVVCLFTLLVWALMVLAMMATVYLTAGMLLGARKATEFVGRHAAARAEARARKSEQGAAVVPAPVPRGRGDELTSPRRNWVSGE